MTGALAAPELGSGGLIGSWSPGIGDPTLGGWLTVLAYLVTAASSRAAARRISKSMAMLAEARRERTFWWALTALFVALGVNKQLDLQSMITEVGRMLAASGGWYEVRRTVQLTFILVVAAFGAAGAALLFVLVRKASLGARIAAVGTALVVIFVVVRAASFHHMDRLIDERWLGLRANWILELGGIAVALAGTLVQRRAFSRAR